MGKYSYICNHKPDASGRHIGESVTLLFSRGNLVNFNLDEDYAATLITCYSHAAARRGEYTGVGLLFITSKGLPEPPRDSKQPAPHFPFINPPTLIGALREA